MFRNQFMTGASFSDFKLHLPDIEIHSFRVSEKSTLVGNSLVKIELRKRFKVTVLAIQRNSQILSNPHGDMQLFANDIIFVLGAPDRIAEIVSLFHDKEAGMLIL
jgi:monovalent cation:H+ antiporter-2, CPA2 family